MKWTEQQILETLRLIEESDFDEVRLETDDFRLHVRKSGVPPSQAGLQPTDAVPKERTAPGRAPAQGAATDGQPGGNRAVEGEPAVPEGMVAIRAPMMGTFYRAPAPHLPPFVEVGANVTPDDTVCLIEVMKLFSTLKAGTAGKVVRILAQNAAAIKRDQVLMLIERG